MISDESSSDSETGRFKGTSQKKDHDEDRGKGSRSHHRSRPSDNDRFRKEFDRKRGNFDSRDRNRHTRLSPARRRSRENRVSPVRRTSRDRSPRRTYDRPKYEHKRSESRSHRSHSRDRHKPLKSHRSDEQGKDIKDEIRKHIGRDHKLDRARKSRERKQSRSASPEYKGKKSVVQIPPSISKPKEKSQSPQPLKKKESSENEPEEVKPGSYYKMVPVVVKEKSEESSIDSSDDEKLRAKLLNLEKELEKTRKKKHHKKKHKRKTSKSKDKDQDQDPPDEVTSTTDIQDETKDITGPTSETAEVTSTQKVVKKESSEEGEISSDDDSQKDQYDPSDLRYKLKRSTPREETSNADLRDRLKNKPDVCGPALPPHLERRFKERLSPEVQGPVLPPHSRDRNIGPIITEEMRNQLAETREVIKYISSDDDDECIGPLPVGEEQKWSEAHRRLEERALDMKIKHLDGHSFKQSDVKSREQWMLELPEGKAKYIGLEARSFRAKEGPDMSDRSSWTDTPEEKARKAAGLKKEEDDHEALQREARAKHIYERDKQQEEASRKHKKKHKREESLLDIHQKKLKKKKKKDDKEEKKERRPFSRDVDLQVNRFDDAQKKSIIKKAQHLDTRFSSGEAKYL